MPQQKYRSKDEGEQWGPAVQFGIVGLATANELSVLEVNGLVPEVRLR